MAPVPARTGLCSDGQRILVQEGDMEQQFRTLLGCLFLALFLNRAGFRLFYGTTRHVT